MPREGVGALEYGRLRPVLAIGVAVLVAACGAANPTLGPSSRPASPTVVPTSIPSGMIVLTSAPPQPPSGLADPSTPAYQGSSGFTPDAVRVLTVLSLQLGLERYKSEDGAYPTTLAALFPADAPLGQDGKPMSGPPAQSDGYTYTGGGATYTLSVVLASGKAYTVSSPGQP